MKRDRFTCSYCGAPGTDAELEIDHIIPVAKGGSNHMSNLTTACRAFNQSKGARASPAEKRPPPSAHPIVGMWLHTLTAEGEIEWQGKILAATADGLFYVELYSWWDGGPTNVVAMEKDRVHDPAQCRVYRTTEARDDAYEKNDRRFRHKYPRLA